MIWEHAHAWWPGLLLLGVSRLFWIALLAVLVWSVIRWFTTRATPLTSYPPMTPPTQPAALEVLRQRYARGEIDATTFEQMREHLEASYRQSQQHHL